MTKRRPEELLQAWREMPIPEEARGAAAARRQRVVGGLASAIGRAAEKRDRAARVRRWVAFAAAAAVLGVGVAGAWLATRDAPSEVASAPETPAATLVDALGTVSVLRDGVAIPVSAEPQAALGIGEGLSTGADGRAEVRLPSGATAALRGQTRVIITSLVSPTVPSARAEKIRVAEGEAFFTVPARGADETFEVVTADSEVIVRGTRFRVGVSGAAADLTTHVFVEEGLVLVRHAGTETALAAGEAWSSRPNAMAVEDVPSPDASTDSKGTPKAPDVASPTSVLAHQNQLYQAAMAARRRGDDPRVVSLLSELLAKYPTGPLAPEAKRERDRALARLGGSD